MIITVVLEALTGSFNTDIDRSAKQAERALKRMEAESRKALGDFGKIIAGAATAAAVGLAAMVKSSINSADELGKLSQKVGIAVDDLSRLAYAAKLSDVDLGSLQQALVKLGDSAVQAQSGTGDAAEAFKALGVSVKDSEGNLKPLNELLLEVADSVAQYEDGAAKGAAVTDIFGKSAANLIPFLNGGSAAIREMGQELETFGGVITQEVAEGANQFNDNLDRITEASKGLVAQVASALLPEMIRLTEQFIAFVKEGKIADEIIPKITSGLNVLAAVARTVSNVLEIAAQDLAGLFGAIAAAGSGDFKGALGILREALADSEADVLDIYAAWNLVTKGTQGAAQEAARFGQFLDDLNFTRTKGALVYDPKAAELAAAAAKKAAQEARRFQEALIQGGAEIFQAQQERERAILEASLDARQVSYKEYLSERLRLTEAAIDQEIAASQALLQNAEADEAVLLQARIESLEIRRQIAQDEAAQDEAKHVREISAAYDDATASARSYLNAITREGERTLALLSATPAQRRFAQGQFQIDDRFISERERLDQEFASGALEREAYADRLQLLQTSHANELAEWTKYYDAIEAKQNDFTTSFNNAIQEYVDATSNVGQALGDTLVSAFDRAADGISHAAAELILFGEDGRAAIAALARSIATELLSALIRVGIQALINKTLISSTTAGAGGGGFASLFGFASGGYVGDDPRNKVAGVVHGQEFVVNADATRENRALLEQINNGTLSDGVSVPRASTQSSKTGMTQRIINVWDKSDIKDYLMGSDGDDVFINWAGRNGSRLRNIVQSA